MKDIFSDLYDRVLSFFTTQSSDDTKVMAKSRLRTVLMQDRVGFSERAMQMLKDDLIESISKYLEIDEESFDLSIDAKENATILNLSIPVLRTKTDEEIDEALNAQEKQKIEKTQEIVDELQELVKEKAQELAEQLTEESEGEVAQEEKEQNKNLEEQPKEENKTTKKGK
ncbi:MAG: cell division topological specificity factor MinE [Candidatus Gastranaerophilales bacterium]|nr:cell division topological specificity factor MinE [Candidatus Gastranaerophilales bacterium]